MTAKKKDVDVIIPEVHGVTVDGIRCRVKRIRTREAIGLVRFLVKGVASDALDKFDSSSSEASAQAAALVIAALPNAIDEALLFLRDIVEAVNPEEASALTYALRNPDLSDLVDIITVVIDQEWADAHELMGKVTALAGSMKSRNPRATGT